MKKHLHLVLLCLFSVCLGLKAEVYSGECGKTGSNLSWTLDTETGELVISGEGEMNNNPWIAYKDYIRSVSIQDGVTSIVREGFKDCSTLTEIELPNSITDIDICAFYNCSALSNITIPNAITTISAGLFYGCSALIEISIPDGVESIGNNAFYECSSLRSVFMPNSIISLGTNVFAYCSALININIPNGINSIPQGTFRDCSALSYINLTNNIKEIGYQAFWGCSALTTITIPYNITKIGTYAFSLCKNLKTIINFSNLLITKGSSHGEIALYANKIINAPNGFVDGDFVWIETEEAKTLAGYFGVANELTLPITNQGESYNIGEYAFQGCLTLKSITIPNCVTSIEKNAFYGCSSLTSITIPNSVTNIGNNAFCGCSHLIEITIPNSVVTIGSCAFGSCSALTSFIIPNSVTKIGDYLFSGCSKLTNVTIGSGVKSGMYGCFRGCSNLRSIISLIPAEEIFRDDTDALYWSNGDLDSFDKKACTLYVLHGAKSTYETTPPWNRFANIVALSEAITINQYGSGTYCSDCALDFSNVDGLKAYAATGYKSKTGVITLTRVMTAKAGMGLFIKGEPGEYSVPVLEETDENSLNMLVGTLEETSINRTSNDGIYINYKYTIKSGDKSPLFYEFSDGSTLSAGKAYLQIPVAWLAESADARQISIRFDEGNTTDIEELEDTSKGIIYYNLMGRKVNNPQKGVIYIVNGKKTMFD